MGFIRAGSEQVVDHRRLGRTVRIRRRDRGLECRGRSQLRIGWYHQSETFCRLDGMDGVWCCCPMDLGEEKERKSSQDLTVSGWAVKAVLAPEKGQNFRAVSVGNILQAAAHVIGSATQRIVIGR
jgi:hypothetical protein